MNAVAADSNAAADVWTEQDTSPAAIEEALRDLLRVRHAANQGLAPARVLNLVVVVDCDSKEEISSRLQRVGRYHASRTILCAVQPGRTTLNARVVMSYEQPEDPAGFGLIREIVEIDMGPDHLERLETIVDPVIVSDLPTMVWSPHGHEQTLEALSDLTDVVLFDSDDDADVPDAFGRARSQLHLSYVVDLAWLRTTPWRERLAASFDPWQRRRALDEITEFAIRHRAGASASALLLAGWLSSRLGWEASALTATDPDTFEGAISADGRTVELRIEAVEQEAPGLAGVTVSSAGFSLSLDRGPGGLRAHAERDGQERTWRVLGHSRGEAGILGEGVRQALLRDPTYGPALAAASRFC